MFSPVNLDRAHLGDSWVLDITVCPNEVVFELDLVLLPGHPAYQPPSPGEQYCYRSAALRFPGLREVTWRLGEQEPAADASGEVDYGNIDTLRTDGEVYELDGDWGAMRLIADPPVVDLL